MNTLEASHPVQPQATFRPRPRSESSHLGHGPLITILFAVAGCLLLAFLGAPYYRLELADRLHHPLHPNLKPNGPVGLLYGYGGTFLLLLLVAYSARKRWRVLAGLGRLNRWLNVHIFCGIVGPTLITLHSGFRIHGLIAIGYWSMIGVMASGFVGYYLYRQIPRALSGAALAAESLRGEIDALDLELTQRYGMTPAELATLRQLAGVDRAARSQPLASLMYFLRQDVVFALGARSAGAPRGRDRSQTRALRELMTRRVRIERRRAFLRQAESLFGYWHSIHKPFAILLYVMMAVHIGVAIWLGYAWAW